MAEHRVPMLGAALRRRVDPAQSRDPQVRELVSALATLEVAPAPRADFRAELRAQLVAVTPRLVAEGKAEIEQAHKQPAATAAAPQQRRLHLKKPLLAAVGVLTAFVLLLGGAVLISQNALPGDALYGLKRASEDTEYSLAGGAVDRGKLKLEFAGNRIGEVGDLLGTPGALGPGVGAVADGGQVSSATGKLVLETLRSADGDVLTASQLLTGAAVNSRSAGPLDEITSWAPDQLAAVRQIIARVAADPGLRTAAVHTHNLILGAVGHANALRGQLNCSCLQQSGTGRFGPIPCSTGCSSGKTGTPGTPGGGQPGRSGGSSTVPTPPKPGSPTPRAVSSSPTKGGRVSTTPGQPAPHPSTSAAKSPTPAPRSSGSTSPVLPIPLPTGSLPVPHPSGHHSKSKGDPKPSLPVVVNSCGASASLGPISIVVGHC